MNEHWLVIGASSAIARAIVREIAARGADVTLVGRDLQDLEASAADAGLRGAGRAQARICDVSQAPSRQKLIEEISNLEAPLNVLVAAGSMPEQDLMDKDPNLLQQMIDATYSGPMALLQGLAPKLEQQGGGRVVVIGSVAGDRGRRKNYLYGSAKAGLATYAEGLRARLFACGASVTLVKPGFIDTAMTWGLPGLFLVSSPQACAQAILKAAQQRRPVIYHPGFWFFIMLIIKHIPPSIMKRLAF